MKRIILVMLCSVLFLFNINAQNNKTTKVYFTAGEYTNDAPGICGEHVKTRLDVLFKPDYCMVKSNGIIAKYIHISEVKMD
jgi:hypothetical protein